jgi:hypothetical protein
LDAHVHGEAELNIVFEGRELLMELESPSFNLVGFEHEPKSLDQQKLVENTIESLKDFRQIASISPEADCKLIDASISTTMKGLGDGRKEHHEDEHHEDEHHEDEHHEDEHHEDEHHEDEHHEDEHHEDEHHEDEHHEDEHQHSAKEIHSEFSATYSLRCDKPENLKSIKLEIFSTFELMEEIAVQMIIQGKQGFAELNPDNPNLKL